MSTKTHSRMPQKHPHHPASPEGGEEKPWPSDDYENIGTAGDRDEPQTSRRPPAGHWQDRSPENGEPYQPYAESNAGTAGGAGSPRQANGGFSNRPTDVEAAYEESASRAAADGDLDRRGEAGRRCAQCWGTPD